MPPKAPATDRRRAAVYVRISKDLAGRSLGVQRQESECRQLAEGHAWDVVEVYVDNDTEASSGRPRPAYLRMLDDMKSGRVNAVVAWHPDRIVRRPIELEDLILIADEHDVVFGLVKAGLYDLTTSSGRLVARLLGATAKYETELKGERQAAQLRQRRDAGLPTGGGARPYGWEDGGMVVQPAEAAVIRDLVARALAGEKVGALTEWLTEHGIPSVSGKPWHPTVVRRLLMNPRLAGLMTHEGTLTGVRAAWEPIIDETTHRRLLAVLTYRGPARRNTGRIALLPGIIWCGLCGYELVTFRQQREGPPPGMRSYGCRTRYLPGRPGHLKSCGRISIRAEACEEDVVERVLARLLNPDSAAKLSTAAEREDAAPDAMLVELAAAEERLRSLGVDYADGLLGRPEFLAARDRLSERIEALRRDAGTPLRLDVPYADAEGLAAWWESASLAKRQALIRQTVDRVEIGPHAGGRAFYDPNRLTITWR